MPGLFAALVIAQVAQPPAPGLRLEGSARSRNKEVPPSGWPACPLDCSGHGTCSHIGVCSCRRGWAGEACDVPRCPERCSGHGHCLASDLAAACVCDEGYVGYDCAALQPPPPPAVPPGSIAPPAPPEFEFEISKLGI